MKKILSIVLTLFIIMSAVSISTISVSASTQNVSFGQQYSYKYTDKNCYGTFYVPSTGIVKLSLLLPYNSYGSKCSIYFSLSKDTTSIISNKYIYQDGNYYLFLDKGSYTYNLCLSTSTIPNYPINYVISYSSNYNDYVNSVSFDKIYTHYYGSKNCYASFELKEASTVTFTLSQPINIVNKTAESAYIKIYDLNSNGKEIINEYYSRSNSYAYTYTVRLPKGKYRFNYYCSSVYATTNGFLRESELIACSYKISAKKASPPKTPKLSHKVTVTKYSTYNKYSVDASYPDNQAYDGVELWIKTDNQKWILKQTVQNTKYSRYTKVYVTSYSYNNYVTFYKVRTYSLYGTQKVYSNFSNTLYTKTSLKPKTPSVSLKSAKKAVKISWKRVSDADGYYIYRSTKKNSGYKKVKTITKGSTVSYTNSKLSSRKTYYFKVKSYKKVNGVTINSNYSSVKSVKVK